MARPLIALLTDFGVRDHYAATMKGVALSICPEVEFIDISHDLPPHDVLTGALELAAAYRYFPSGTVFLVVVDPGVGSSRRGIAVEAGHHRFVAPDNGLLTVVLDETPASHVVELTDSRYARPTVSRTFEGRDRFAPAAAWLASGISIEALGPPARWVARLDIPRARVEDDAIVGEVLRVDRFGNLITNLDQAMVDRMGGTATVDVGSRRVPRIVSTYADVPPGDLCALVGSSDRLEVAVNGGNAAEALGLERGAVVRLRQGDARSG